MSARIPEPQQWPSAATGRVVVVGPNPAMDRLEVVDELVPGQVHRASSVTVRAGGKSFIVSRTIRRRGVGVSMYGFLGGPVGTLVADACVELGIDDRHTPIADSTRITPVIVERATGRSTVINEAGPQITPGEESAFRAAMLEAVAPGDLLVCTGSLPPSLAPALYAELAAHAASTGAYCVVDASGEPLRAALEVAPWAVKCNRSEFAAANGLGTAPADDVIAERMLTQLDRGSSVVIVTMGGAAFLVAVAGACWRVTVPPTDVVNATGSGDTFLGCFAAAIADGEGLETALRYGTAGGVLNAAQLEPGLQPGADLDGIAAQVRVLPEPAPSAVVAG
ncbi:PfkB family carbohydrate kinase [Leifsonia sp. F6_8S_P_1B]|uniref:PfkB family carbohydrate kinase n=1 Tax=Leifsonia williamsii TaxID=3035919 RepID=A0ABT8K922_9MICO|nr:PfkB family carbohydrate kinase [Leifsonia williamsii]MDN4613537.1 PfkB family carbohydrate kinase [Leifsonia williamsii]